MNTQDYYDNKNQTEPKEPERKDVTFKDVLKKSWLMLIPGVVLAFMAYGILTAISPALDSLGVFIMIAFTILFALLLGCYRVYGTETVEIVQPNGTVKLKKKNKYRWYLWIGLAVYIIAFFTAADAIGARTNNVVSSPAMVAESSTQVSSQPATQDQTATETTQAPATTDTTTNTQPAFTTYGPGTLKVGVDVPAGDYVALAYDYIEIDSDSSGEFESILDNVNSGLYGYVSLNDGEYVTIKGGALTPVSEAPSFNSENYTNGIYLIGRDIPAGEYQLTTLGKGSGYWERNSQPVSSENSVYTIIANENFEDSTYVTVEDGEYLTLSGNAVLKKTQ